MRRAPNFATWFGCKNPIRLRFFVTATIRCCAALSSSWEEMACCTPTAAFLTTALIPDNTTQGRCCFDRSASVKDSAFKTFAQEQEYAADLHAIRNVTSHRQRDALAIAAFNLFTYLHLYELLAAVRFEIRKFSISNTHPTPIDRLENLNSRVSTRFDGSGFRPDKVTEVGIEYRDMLLQRILNSPQEDPLNFYGSIYLRGLGGVMRRDRIDF